MRNYQIVDAGALQMLKNAVLRISEEQNRPVLKEMVEEVNLTIVNVSEVKVEGSDSKRTFVEN